MIKPLNALTKKNVPFKWTKQYQQSLDYITHVITTNSILVYPDPDKQYFLFMDSNKQAWCGILIQYMELLKQGGTKLKVPHPVTCQSGTFLGSQKNWSINLCRFLILLYHSVVGTFSEIEHMLYKTSFHPNTAGPHQVWACA